LNEKIDIQCEGFFSSWDIFQCKYFFSHSQNKVKTHQNLKYVFSVPLSQIFRGKEKKIASRNKKN